MIVLDLPLGPSLNMAYRNVPKRGRVATKLLNDWKRAADAAYLAQKRHVSPVKGQYKLSLIIKEQGFRGDPDNRIKIVSDALKRWGLIVDDTHRYCKGISVSFGEAPEGCRVIVTSVDYTTATAKAVDAVAIASAGEP